MDKKIILTPASAMTWGDTDTSRHKRRNPHSLHSPNQKKKFAIYTPGKAAPIMTTAVNHTTSAGYDVRG